MRARAEGASAWLSYLLDSLDPSTKSARLLRGMIGRMRYTIPQQHRTGSSCRQECTLIGSLDIGLSLSSEENCRVCIDSARGPPSLS
jgi:hypothetical protein